MSKQFSDESIDYLMDEIHSIINMLKLALLAAKEEEDELVPTAIETAFCQLQNLLDEYCKVGDE